MSRKVRLSNCQYLARQISDEREFASRVSGHLDRSADADLVLFPELFTIELFTLINNWRQKSLTELTLLSDFTDFYVSLFKDEAKKRGQYIAAGSHLIAVDDRYENVAFLFAPDGRIHTHSKTHIFPAEASWSTSEGVDMKVIDLPFAKIGFNVCYETEIPECSASLTEQGVEIILSPSATFTENGFWRVRHCAQSRCVENQIYLVHSCLGGQPGAPLPNAWARSSILGPCDLPWANPAGIIAEAPTNAEATISAVVDIDLLHENRHSGAATTFKDRRRRATLYRDWPSHIGDHELT